MEAVELLTFANDLAVLLGVDSKVKLNFAAEWTTDMIWEWM